MPESDKLPEELTQEKVLKGWRESVNTIPEEYFFNEKWNM